MATTAPTTTQPRSNPISRPAPSPFNTGGVVFTKTGPVSVAPSPTVKPSAYTPSPAATSRGGSRGGSHPVSSKQAATTSASTLTEQKTTQPQPTNNVSTLPTREQLIQTELNRNVPFSWYNLGGYVEHKLFVNVPAYRNAVTKGPTYAEGAAARPVLTPVVSFAKSITDTVPVVAFTSPLMMTGLQQTKFNEGFRNLQQQEVIQKANKYPYIGTRSIAGDTAKDVFGKNVATSDASISSRGIVVNKMTGANTYAYGGQVTNKVVTNDLIGTFRTPAKYTETTTNVIAGYGRLLPTQTGITPSFGKSNTLGLLNMKSSGGEVAANILPRGYKPEQGAFGGRTALKQNYVVSQSGKLNRIDILGPFESGAYKTKVAFSKDTGAILKIREIPSYSGSEGIITIQKGSFGSFAGQSTSQVSALKSVSPVIPKISSPRAGLQTSTLVGPSLVTSGALAFTTTVSATKLTSQTITTPKTSQITTQIPRTTTIPNVGVNTIRGLASSTSTTLIPASASITIPASGSSTTMTPFFSSDLPFPVTNVPAFFPLPPLAGAGGYMFNRKVGAKRRSKYTPDYAGLILNIKGKAPKRITGAEIRPIPKGFSFNFGGGKSKLFSKWF